ncbi:hypothetical protein J1N35_001356 [Gossypium stocksii]|uniref:Uncharacterized protein n=1 Tax=Gossypium stocksii TaxID=47602 RepID=A0A9D4AM18_9ROSI|nr:hypothetical protein J1N35_001356 [Gossypium stocksii]
MLSKETQPKPTKNDTTKERKRNRKEIEKFKKNFVRLQDKLTENMLEMCTQSQLVILMIIESTTDNDGILVEALNLDDELQQIPILCVRRILDVSDF